MKRFWLVLLSVIFSMMFASSAMAVEGACVQSIEKFQTANPNLRIVTLTCLGSDNDGDFPSINVAAAITAQITGWYISEVRTYPGAKAPQNGWDITIKDTDGFDLMGGTLADRTQSAQRALPLWTTATYASVPIYGTLAVAITDTNVTVSTPIIKLFLVKK